MFTKTSYHIGSFEVVSIRNSAGIGVDFIPQKAGAINQLYMGEEASPIFDSFMKGDDIDLNPWYKQALLFPFPNRLADGTYSFEGKEYQFPLNDKTNALHGFLFKEELVIDQLELLDHKAIIKMSYDYNGNYEYYPFPCKLNITYTITKSTFRLNFKIKNVGISSLPYGFGWHPYFKFDDNLRISMSASRLQVVNNRSIPTGEEKQFDRFKDYLEISEHLDTCFVFNDRKEPIKLGDSKKHRVEIDADKSMNFVQLFNPEYTRIAIEPLTCNIDSFNNKIGLKVLMPNEGNNHECRILFKEINRK